MSHGYPSLGYSHMLLRVTLVPWMGWRDAAKEQMISLEENGSTVVLNKVRRFGDSRAGKAIITLSLAYKE